MIDRHWHGRTLSALHTLLKTGRIPRYQVEGTNTESIRLAQSLGLRHILTITHYLPGGRQ